MRGNSPSRVCSISRPGLDCTAWLLLVVLLIPCLASPRALCCGPRQSKIPACCNASMKMTEMSAEAMNAMAADKHSLDLIAVRCAPISNLAFPDVLGKAEGLSSQELQLGREMRAPSEGICARPVLSEAPDFSRSETPPIPQRFDPIAVSLRI